MFIPERHYDTKPVKIGTDEKGRQVANNPSSKSMKINASLSSVSKSHYCFCLLVCFLFSCCLHTSVHFVRSGLILFTDKRQNIKTEKIKLKERGVFSSFLFRLNSVLKLQTGT